MEILSKKYQKIKNLFKNFLEGNILSKRFKASRQLDLGLVKKEKNRWDSSLFLGIYAQKKELSLNADFVYLDLHAWTNRYCQSKHFKNRITSLQMMQYQEEIKL